jgi:hypothetical protein
VFRAINIADGAQVAVKVMKLSKDTERLMANGRFVCFNTIIVVIDNRF